MTRWKAASIHLGISATIGILVAALLFGVWYPQPYFHAAGADELVLLLVGVDLTIGPLLTLIVFRPGKKGLKFDLSVIAIAQSVALIYGLGVVLQARPVFLVGVIDRFVLVAANQVTDADLEAGSAPQFRQRSWSGPQLTVVEMPTDPKELSDLAFSAVEGRDAQNLPRYYREFATQGRNLLKGAQPLAKLFTKKPDSRASVEDWLRSHARTEDTVRWLPLVAEKADMVMLIDADSAAPLQAFAIDPW